MTKQAEAQLLDFLSRNDNLPFVVDILRFGDPIRERLLKMFWEEVNASLELYAAKPSLASTSMKLELCTVKDPFASHIYVWDVSLDGEEHYLSYLLVLERWKRSVSVDYCVVGQCAFKDVPEELYMLPPVVKLIEHLKSMGLGQPGKEYLSLGYREICGYDSLDEFLASFVHDKESLLGEICETFWPGVTETIDLVQEANKALVEAVKAKQEEDGNDRLA